MVSPECAPFSKVGGLADMVSSLSKEFAADGCEVKIFTPLYSSIKRGSSFKKEMDNLSVHMGLGIEEFASVWRAPLGKAGVHFLEFNRYYDRPGIYNYGAVSYDDNGGRFAFLSRAAIDYCLSTACSRRHPLPRLDDGAYPSIFKHDPPRLRARTHRDGLHYPQPATSGRFRQGRSRIRGHSDVGVPRRFVRVLRKPEHDEGWPLQLLENHDGKPHLRL